MPERRFVNFVETIGAIPQLKRGSVSVQEELFVIFNECGVIALSLILLL